jgi:hypothetical protein
VQPCAAVALPLSHPKLTVPLLLLMVNVFVLLHNKNLQWRNFKQKYFLKTQRSKMKFEPQM